MGTEKTYKKSMKLLKKFMAQPDSKEIIEKTLANIGPMEGPTFDEYLKLLKTNGFL
jgi:hypothetical protein